MSTIKLAMIMDPIENINIVKDSSFAMLLAAQKRGWSIHYIRPQQMYVKDGIACARSSTIKVEDNPESWFSIQSEEESALHVFDVILMRKDPPFNMDYIYLTYLLELAEKQGCLVVNKAASLRDANEKLFTAWFPDCCVPTLVSSDRQQLLEFIETHQDTIFKPLDGMGGASIFRVRSDDPNRNVIIETLTDFGQRLIMAQRFIPEITEGDKRILLVNGKPAPYALARIPTKGETRGNLAAGGSGVGVELTERDYWICEQVAPTLIEKDLLFVGLDVIGDYITEINVTSPTCIRELDKQYNLDIAADLMDAIEQKLKTKN